MGTFRFYLKNLHQPFQDLSRSVLAQHEDHPTRVGMPDDGVEQQLVGKLH